MNQYKRAKINKILLIVAVVVVVIAIIATIIYIAVKNKNLKEEISYDDTIVGNNYFSTIVIDTETKKVKRDNTETTLQQEFDLDEGRVNLILNSTTELISFFENSTIEVELKEGEIDLKDPYQTKAILVETDSIKDNFDAIEETELQEGLYILKYDTEKRTKAAYEYLKNQPGIKNIELDKVMLIKTINDESQTVYGETKSNENENKSNVYGVSAMGIDNYKNIINENGNPSEVTIATIGYGARIDNSYFQNRISEDYYNFITNSKDVHETIPQGSRTLEVIKESTTDNIKIMPLVVINDENYTTTESILRAISFATQKADAICYEFTHQNDYMIELVLRNAFKENVPVCCVTKMATDNEEMFPANDATTIAVSSVDKSLKTTSYSGSGDYLDFVASSTDVKEIFNTTSSVSKWSGAEYSNAHIVSIIALIKTYNKDFTILEVYNVIRNYCKDLGDKGKDITYGYGFPDFSNIKISDIDKQTPVFKEIAIDNEKWEKLKQVQIKAEDNIKIYGWSITKTQDVPSDWNKLEKNSTTLDVTGEIKENGPHYVWVTDSAGNAKYEMKEINKIDIAPPTIQYAIDNSKKDTEKYITINITATDNESGLHDMPYSWDKQNWGTDNKTLKVTENGTYTIYVRDKLENISEKKITIKSFPQEGIADIDVGTIIKGIRVSSNWEGNKNKEVTITFNDNINVQYWKIADTNAIPQEFQETQNENQTNEQTNSTNTTNQNTTNTTTNNNNNNTNNNSQGYTNMTITVSLDANRRYYLWIRDGNGKVSSQAFSIRKSE